MIGVTLDYGAEDFYQVTGTIPRDEAAFTSTGSSSWTVPTGVRSVSIVCVGAGGGVC
jgi:hypothetical protein